MTRQRREAPERLPTVGEGYAAVFLCVWPTKAVQVRFGDPARPKALTIHGDSDEGTRDATSGDEGRARDRYLGKVAL